MSLFLFKWISLVVLFTVVIIVGLIRKTTNQHSFSWRRLPSELLEWYKDDLKAAIEATFGIMLFVGVIVLVTALVF